MSPQANEPSSNRWSASARRAAWIFVDMLPIVVATVLLMTLVLEILPTDWLTRWSGRLACVDALAGAVLGGIAAGNPATSYVIGGELLGRGFSLIGVTAFLVSWVSVGSLQLPAEALMLGWRFALYRNVIAFVSAVAIAVAAVATLDLLGPGP